MSSQREGRKVFPPPWPLLGEQQDGPCVLCPFPVLPLSAAEDTVANAPGGPVLWRESDAASQGEPRGCGQSRCDLVPFPAAQPPSQCGVTGLRRGLWR